MSSFILKMIGILTMTVDHIGSIVFPDLLFLRVIGRLAYPIFAFLISEGYRKTGDVTDYIGRLLVFAFFSQLAYQHVFGTERLNVLFTFALALYAIYKYEKTNNILVVFIVALAAQLLHTEYGAYGVLMVFIFYRYHHNFKETVKYFSLLAIAYVGYNVVSNYSDIQNSTILFISIIQLFTIPSLLLIYLYNGKRGPRAKYLFYVFYPGHILLIHYIYELIINYKVQRILGQ
ncbi:MAG: TraX family protein [Halanaerobiales bacterium]